MTTRAPYKQTFEPEPGSVAEIVSTDDPRLAELEKLASLLDARFRVPVLGIRFGWDSLLGFIPGIGDAAAMLPAAWLIWRGHRMGARRRTLARMALNTGVDSVVGAIPVVGDLFDIGFKSNRRNVALLRRELTASSALRDNSAEKRWRNEAVIEGRSR